MREEYEKQEDTGTHLLDKLPIGEVISSVCTCRNAELEKDSLFPVYCCNCNAYVQAQNGLLGEGDILLIKRLVKQPDDHYKDMRKILMPYLIRWHESKVKNLSSNPVVINSVLGGWIDVKEKKPSKYETVLVCHKNGNVGRSLWNNFYNHWHFYGVKHYGVTHWMPLPKPPKTVL